MSDRSGPREPLDRSLRSGAMATERSGIIAGFRDFIVRGNVVDLAVAVVLGAAFTAIVNAFAIDFVGSLIAAVGGVPDLDGVGWKVNGTQILIGPVLTATVNFLIVAAVVYFLVVVPINRIKALRDDEPGQPVDAPPVPADVALLTEIRDLLRDGAASSRRAPPA